jgi:uncharacterized protein YbaR (Trm112 family)
MSNQAQARLRILKSLDLQTDLTVILDSSGSPSSRLAARFLTNTPEAGMNIETGTAIGPGTLVSIAGEIQTDDGPLPVLGQYRVKAGNPVGAGRYHIHVLPQAADTASNAPKAAPADDADVDYYEILQVSRRADTEAIHRVFHVLAQRYHPDNRETGDQDKFRQVVDAHNVLTNRERRAAYDVQLADEDKGRLRIFESLESTQGVQAEMRKRQGILRLLYTRRLTDPYSPAMRGRELSDMLGCPAEHLDFSYWFLREQKLINRADNNQYEITWQGVEAFEASEANFGKKQPLTLPAPAQAG